MQYHSNEKDRGIDFGEKNDVNKKCPSNFSPFLPLFY
jgi:hypothetical protein